MSKILRTGRAKVIFCVISAVLTIGELNTSTRKICHEIMDLLMYDEKRKPVLQMSQSG